MKEAEKDIDLIDSEEKKKPHKLLSMQAIMLEDQKSNPSINVHNFTRLFRYEKSALNIEKFISAFNQTFKHHPIFLTVLHKNSDNTVSQVYRPDLFKSIELEKISESDFQEKIKINKDIYTNFQFNLYDNLLVNFKLYETENYLYEFIDHHHIMIDGFSLKLMHHTLEKYYFDKNEEISPDRYFYRLKQIEDAISSPDYPLEKKIYEEKYTSESIIGCPLREEGRQEIKGLDWHIFTVNIPQKIFQNFGDKDFLYNNYIVLASILAIAKSTGKKDIMVTWSHHGRPNEMTRHIVGNFVRIYPIRIKLDENNKIRIKNIMEEIAKQSKDLLKRKYYPFMFEYEYDVDIMNIIYEKDFFEEGFIGKTKRETIKIPQRDVSQGVFINQCIDGCYILEGVDLRVEWQYPFSKFSKETMEKFEKIFTVYFHKLIEHWEEDKEIDYYKLFDE